MEHLSSNGSKNVCISSFGSFLQQSVGRFLAMKDGVEHVHVPDVDFAEEETALTA